MILLCITPKHIIAILSETFPRIYLEIQLSSLDFNEIDDLFDLIVFIRELDGQRNGARLEPKKIAKAPDGEGCPRCGGYVYAAEQMLARGRVSKCLTKPPMWLVV